MLHDVRYGANSVCTHQPVIAVRQSHIYRSCNLFYEFSVADIGLCCRGGVVGAEGQRHSVVGFNALKGDTGHGQGIHAALVIDHIREGRAKDRFDIDLHRRNGEHPVFAAKEGLFGVVFSLIYIDLHEVISCRNRLLFNSDVAVPIVIHDCNDIAHAHDTVLHRNGSGLGFTVVGQVAGCLENEVLRPGFCLGDGNIHGILCAVTMVCLAPNVVPNRVISCISALRNGCGILAVLGQAVKHRAADCLTCVDEILCFADVGQRIGGGSQCDGRVRLCDGEVNAHGLVAQRNGSSISACIHRFPGKGFAVLGKGNGNIRIFQRASLGNNDLYSSSVIGLAGCADGSGAGVAAVCGAGSGDDIVLCGIGQSVILGNGSSAAGIGRAVGAIAVVCIVRLAGMAHVHRHIPLRSGIEAVITIGRGGGGEVPSVHRLDGQGHRRSVHGDQQGLPGAVGVFRQADGAVGIAGGGQSAGLAVEGGFGIDTADLDVFDSVTTGNKRFTQSGRHHQPRQHLIHHVHGVILAGNALIATIQQIAAAGQIVGHAAVFGIGIVSGNALAVCVISIEGDGVGVPAAAVIAPLGVVCQEAGVGAAFVGDGDANMHRVIAGTNQFAIPSDSAIHGIGKFHAGQRRDTFGHFQHAADIEGCF